MSVAKLSASCGPIGVAVPGSKLLGLAGRASRRLGVGELVRRRRLERFLRRGLDLKEDELLLRLSRRRLLSPREWELLLRLLGLRRRFRLRTLRGRGGLWAGPETRSGAEGA